MMLIYRIVSLVVLLAQHNNGDTLEKGTQAKLETRRVDNPTVTCVSRTTDHSGLGIVPYQEILFNEGNGWNTHTNVLHVAEAGTYFFHISAGVRARSTVDLTLQGVSPKITLSRESRTHDGIDTMGRDFISTIAGGSNIYIDNGPESVLYGQADRQTSFTAFSLDHLSDPNDMVVFSVARDTVFASVGEVQFPEVFVNIGDSMNENRFTASKAGIYFFTLSVGAPRNLNVRSQIKISSRPTNPLAELWRSSDTHSNPDIITTAVMAELEVDDQVYIELKDGEIYSSDGHQTYFGGFLYNPSGIGGIEMAWSVYSDTKHITFDEPLDPFPFDGAWVNTNEVFSFDNHNVYITVTGLYYVTLSMGAQASRPVDAFVVLARNKVETNIYRSSVNHNGEDTLNQGIVLRLEEGARVRVVIGPNCRTHSDGDHQTVFTGFLLKSE